MYDKELVLEVLSQIHTAAQRIARRFKNVSAAQDFVSSEEGIDKLDGICMQLIVIGESLKNLDRITNQTLLVRYPQVDWKGTKGIRDVISHHYVDLDEQAVFDVCQKDLPVLIQAIEQIMEEVQNGPSP
jgi:uncharacterized protein with HEPN domain